MGLRSRAQKHKDVSQKDSNSDTCKTMKNPVTYETTGPWHKNSISSLNVVRGHPIKVAYILKNRHR